MDSATLSVTPEQWDAVRDRFKSSMMAHTELNKLAQSIDMSWPFRAKDEIALKYLPMTLDELQMLPAFNNRPDRLRLLVEILTETMAFDDPFSEMAEQVDSSSRQDESATKTLVALEIPEDFPLRFCNLSAETVDFCEAEDLHTVGAFLHFAQNMAQTIVVGGDFRHFLNSFANNDPEVIAEYLPLRPGQSGLHLPEALALLLRRLPVHQRNALILASGGQMPAAELRGIRKLSEAELEQLEVELRPQVEELLQWFREEAHALEALVQRDLRSAERFLVPIDEPNLERAALRLVQSVWGGGTAAKSRPRKGGGFGFLRRLFFR